MGVGRWADLVYASLAVALAVGCESVPENSMSSGAKPISGETSLPFTKEAWSIPPIPGGEIADLYLDRDLLIAVTRNYETHAIGLDGMPRWVNSELTEPPRNRASSSPSNITILSGFDLLALDRRVGKTLRKIRLPFSPSGPPANSETTAYIASFTDQKVHSVSIRDGSQGWSFRTTATVTSRPVLGGTFPRQILYLAAEDGTITAIEALDADSLPPVGPAWQAKAHGRITADLVLSGNLLFVASEDYSLYAIDRVTGEIRWSYPAGLPLTKSPAATADVVYQPTPAGVVAIAAADGRERYQIPRVERFLVQMGKRTLFLDEPNTIVVVSSDTGVEQSRAKLTQAAQFITNPDGRRLFFSDRSGRLYALEEARISPEKPAMSEKPSSL